MSASAPFAPKYKASPPAQCMLPRDILDSPWEEIMTDYFTHKGKECLLISDQFGKVPLLCTRSAPKPAQFLCVLLLELISQYVPLSLLLTDNRQPFASKELAHFLHCHHIEHSTLYLHFPRSNGFIDWQVQTLRTMQSTGQDSYKSIEDVLLDL